MILELLTFSQTKETELQTETEINKRLCSFHNYRETHEFYIERPRGCQNSRYLKAGG